MARVVRKDPDADRKIEVDWAPVLNGATVATSSWEIPLGITATGDAYSGAISEVTVSGGTLRELYELENAITDSNGDPHNASVFLLIEDQIAEPVDRTQAILLSDAKLYLRVSHDEEDTRIRDLIDAATEYIETRIDRDLLTRVRDLVLAEFPDEIEIPRPPTQAVFRIQYYDTDNALQTLATTEWYTYRCGEYTRVILENGSSWRSTISRPDAVIVTYESGYSDTSNGIPKKAKQAILMVNIYVIHRVLWSQRETGQGGMSPDEGGSARMSMPLVLAFDSFC